MAGEYHHTPLAPAPYPPRRTRILRVSRVQPPVRLNRSGNGVVGAISGVYRGLRSCAPQTQETKHHTAGRYDQPLRGVHRVKVTSQLGTGVVPPLPQRKSQEPLCRHFFCHPNCVSRQFPPRLRMPQEKTFPKNLARFSRCLRVRGGKPTGFSQSPARSLPKNGAQEFASHSCGLNADGYNPTLTK